MTEPGATPSCPVCGAAVPLDDAAFCPRCGAPVNGGGQLVPPVPAQSVSPGPGVPGPPTADDRNWAMFAHLSALAMFVGVPSFVGPLVIWLLKRDDHPFIAEHGREALNFNLSVLLYFVVSAILVILIVGIVMLLALGVFWLVVTIQGGMRASRGDAYRYPLTIRFVS